MRCSVTVAWQQHFAGMRPCGVQPKSTMLERYDSRGSTIERDFDDEAPMFYGLFHCRTWAGRYLHAVASPSFPSAEDETEYRQHTYNDGRSFLVRMLLALACLYSVLNLMAAYLTNTVGAEQSRTNVYLVMRFGFVVACAVAGGTLHCMPKMSPTVATLICVLLLYAAVIISYSTSSLVSQHGQQVPPPPLPLPFPLAVAELRPCASLARARRLSVAAPLPGREAGPLVAPPQPRVLEPAACKVLAKVSLIPRPAFGQCRWSGPSRSPRRPSSCTSRSTRSSCPSSRSTTSPWPCSCSLVCRWRFSSPTA
jgi:hypothetical protein